MAAWLLNQVKDNWTRPRGLIVLILGVLLVWLVAAVEFDFTRISWGEVLVVGIALPVLVGVWLWTNRIPKHRPGRLGVGVALTYEEQTQQRRVASDFIARLRDLIDNPHRKIRGSVIEFSSAHAGRVVDYESALALAQASNTAFLLHGRVRRRTLGGKSQHVLDLQGLVRHAPIQTEVSKQLSAEFTELLPRQLRIAEESDLFGFEFTADLIDVIAPYIVGTAAVLSNDLAVAEQLLKELEAKLRNTPPSPIPALAKLRQRLPARIADVYKARMALQYRKYMLERDNAMLVELEQLAIGVQRYDPNYYSAHLQRAISAFMLRRDVEAARRHIACCRDQPDSTWRYSEAFLHAYEGDLSRASSCYKDAFARPLGDPTVPVQSEEFIQIVLDAEPERVHLYFCLGLINLHAKMDGAAARRDFELFLALTEETHWRRQRLLARRWIEKMDRRAARRLVASSPAEQAEDIDDLGPETMR